MSASPIAVSPGDGTGFPLSAAIAYQNADVVDSFLSTWHMPRADAELLFEDVRRWIWLTGRARRAGVHLFIDSKLRLFDEMWHTFILFTKDYTAFCETYVGHYCHHEPTRQHERDETARRAAEEPDALARSVREDYMAFITLVAQELGEDVAVRWFSTYRKVHTREYMRSIHKYGGAAGVP